MEQPELVMKCFTVLVQVAFHRDRIPLAIWVATSPATPTRTKSQAIPERDPNFWLAAADSICLGLRGVMDVI